MRADAVTSLRVGVVVALAMALLMGAIWMLGEKTQLFTAKVQFYSKFRNVVGLEEGSDVRLAGYRIGHVSGIRLPEAIASDIFVIENY